ncbi:hypothetical protein LTS08_006690 [Lithohypha guttulata]|uniref:uncharacterized protein n=1 Tax=Lithohypha guttulata TaxID=1690604 RepID=UPI002DDF13D2|nr:hypothetical protein LTR51_008067 [Lithohypha guttulata]KAK5097935.1 hypothetical protein LTS08_006690 [Lithohypha guttulata]
MSVDVSAPLSFLTLPEEILLQIFRKHYASTLQQHRIAKRKKAAKANKPVYVRPFTQECLDALLISKVTCPAAREAFLQQANFRFKMMEGGDVPGVLHALETNQTIRTMSGDLNTSRALCVHRKYFGRHGRINLKRFLVEEHGTARIDLNQIGRIKHFLWRIDMDRPVFKAMGIEYTGCFRLRSSTMDLACINRPGYDPSFETYSGPYATLTNHESWNCTLEITLHPDGTLTASSHFCWEAVLKKFEDRIFVEEEPVRIIEDVSEE